MDIVAENRGFGEGWMAQGGGGSGIGKIGVLLFADGGAKYIMVPLETLAPLETQEWEIRP